MQIYDKLYIGGSWVPPTSHDAVDVISPTTEEPIGSVPLGTRADIDAAVSAARLAFDQGPWPRLNPTARAAIVTRLSSAIREWTDDFADVISAEVGSLRSWSPLGQVAAANAVFDVTAGFAEAYPWVDTRAGSMGTTLRVRRVPVGVVAAIVPWNAPLFVSALKIAPALVAGATVVLKPALQTSLDAHLLAEAAIEAGVPDGVLNIVPASVAASEHLVRHPGVDKVSFTGSTAVGRRIGELCGHDIRRCTLELGGKSAAILLDDVDLTDRTVAMLVSGAMANNGQVCAALTRILAPRSRYRAVVDALATRASALQVGDPFDASSDIGPLASADQRHRVEEFVAGARRQGATVVTGGGRPAHIDRGWFFDPTVLSEVDPTMTVAREEVFGPVVCVIPYDDEDEAVALANDSEYGLAGAVWTADVDRGETVAARIRTGVVAINSPAPLDLNGPFGGFKCSGIGRESGPEGIDPYTEFQTIVLPRSRAASTVTS